MVHLMFDGAAYHGWQVQANAVTVQKTFQDAVEKVFKSRLDVTGCSRTDAGVHANDYVCNFKTEALIEPRAIMRALNANLPHDIAVTSCLEAAPDFHSRYFAAGKEYIYKINNAPYRDPFTRAYSFYCAKKLDVDLLAAAAANFRGKHDFAAFCSAGAAASHRPESPEGDTVRTIIDTDVTREKDMVIFRVRGDGFLYNMVRIMTGTLLFVAQSKIKPGEITDIIDARERKRAGATAPAQGLYLNKVFYDKESLYGKA